MWTNVLIILAVVVLYFALASLLGKLLQRAHRTQSTPSIDRRRSSKPRTLRMDILA